MRGLFIYLKNVIRFTLLSIIFFNCFVYGQNGTANSDNYKSDQLPVFHSNSTNIEGRMLAGLNGDSMFSFSMTQGLKNFAYQLNSNVSNINDFKKYNNSSFTTNETGFTGELTLTDYWKLIPEFLIANSSYGMFDNLSYSRENKDKLKVRLKNEYKPAPARWELDIIYTRDDHSLTQVNDSLVDENSFYSFKGIIGVEYVWSASNKIGIRSDNGLNSYSGGYKDDSYSLNEVYVSFKVTEYAMVTLSPMLCWDADDTDTFYFKGNISSINLKYISLEILHEYKLVPYDPEDVFYTQKYMYPVYDLPPSTVNHTEFKCELGTNTNSDPGSILGVESARLKVKGIFEDNNNFYNYDDPTSKKILSVEAIPVSFLNGRMEFAAGLVLLSQLINIRLIYDYYKYFPKKQFDDINITYRPDNIFTFNLAYEGSMVEVNWENSFRSKVYVSPINDEQLGSSLIGALDVHVKLYETFYLHSRINNLYNVEYSFRDGYPEPGIQFFLGLRIII
ncbi:MAG: hypothetical protein FWF73_02120 [Spirochaetes bacterium]|nr:hypothetical protein [Spirochaetota bacterium]